MTPRPACAAGPARAAQAREALWHGPLPGPNAYTRLSQGTNQVHEFAWLSVCPMLTQKFDHIRVLPAPSIIQRAAALVVLDVNVRAFGDK